MPIVVTTPASGDNFGPGYQVIAHTTTVGPFPADSIWSIELTAPANEESVMLNFAQVNTNSITMLLVPNGFLSSVMAQARSEWSNGKSGQLRVQFSSVSSGMNESIDVPIVMERSAGQNAELAVWLQRHGSVAGQGLTTEEHDAILTTQAATMAVTGFSPLDLIGPLAEAILTTPPLGWMSVSGPYTLTGDGEVPDLEGFQNRFGVYWLATILPTGLGHLHGQSEEYKLRLVQFRTVHIIGGMETVTEILDAHDHGRAWIFPQQKPVRVEYSILPGVTLEVRWLTIL